MKWRRQPGEVALPVNRGRLLYMKKERAGGAFAVSLVSLALVTACTGAQPHDDGPVRPATSSASRVVDPSPSASTTIDPRAQAAVQAYQRYVTASHNAQRKPPAVGTAYPAGSDFTKYSYDPIRGKFVAYILSLAQSRVAFRGAPPVPRVSVTSINLGASPYPLVVISDCQTPAPTWQAYKLATGKTLPDAPAKAPPPHRLTVKIIKYKGRWGVYDITGDVSRTCTV